MRLARILATAAVLALSQASLPAQAGLVGNGTNTVSVELFLGAAPFPPAPAPPYPNTIDYVNSMGMTTNTPPPTIPVTYLEDALTETTIGVDDTQITITNNAPSGIPFCLVAAPCNDTFAGFGFTFTGVDITGVSVDPASAAGFLPNTTAPHMGLQLLSPTDILVDVTGDAPNTGDATHSRRNDRDHAAAIRTRAAEPRIAGQRADRPAGGQAESEKELDRRQRMSVTEVLGS